MKAKNLEKISNHSKCMEEGLRAICNNGQHKYRSKDDPLREMASAEIKKSVRTARGCRTEYLRSSTDYKETEKCIACEFNPENYARKLILYRDS